MTSKWIVMMRFLFAVIVVQMAMGARLKMKSFCPHTKCFCPVRNVADCSYKNISVIPRGLPITIQRILLSGNNFLELRDHTFNHIMDMNIKYLALDHCNIRKISPLAFINLKDLRFLDLSYNELTFKCMEEGFIRLGISEVKILNISGNLREPRSLKSLFKVAWLRELKELVIQKNKILTINFSSFSDLRKLRRLDLSDNGMVTAGFSNMSSLREIDLSHNVLEQTPINFCDELYGKSFFPNLAKLHLRHNRLTETFSFLLHCRCLPSLVYLDISYNPFNIILSNSFVTCRKLSVLIIDYILELGVNLENTSLTSNVLETLFIGSNDISNVDYRFRFVFNYCTSLKRLQIMNVNFSSFEKFDFSLMFHPLRKLRSISFIRCELYQVPNMRNISGIKKLNLNFNKINVLYAEEFENLRKLEKVSFTGNQLITIQKAFLPDFVWRKKEISIDFSANPFSCDCKIEWFKTWLESNSVKMKRYPNDYICQSPQKWKGRSLAEFQLRDCHLPNQYVILSFILCGILFIFIFSVVIIRKLRWDIKYYIHICSHRKSKYKKLSEDEADFDGFVAYSSRDRRWIMAELVEHLEKEHNYSLFLYERNLLPGGVFIEDIHDSIDYSRKLILVLSNNFMTDHWCQYEAAIAKHTIADGKGDKIVVILLENLNSKHITSSFKTLLKSTQNAEWTNSVNGQKLFWKRIIEIMSK
ncbi:toll-like receptor 3 [Saccostrea cucullata]|uniref:toll-like receptor 3 n=1 Tax=Saccostrea cuccullata TaxID=36930 RepID=UPI002ED504DA